MVPPADAPPVVVAPVVASREHVRPESAPVPADAAAVPVEPATNGNAPEETNVWPDEAAETAFLAETRARGEPVRIPVAAVAEEPEPKALPPLDELVQRIPAGTREVLEDLFRARFTTVRRVRKSDLKI